MSTILISGQWLWPHYQAACARALERIGHKTVKFSWHQHFFETYPDKDPQFKSFLIQRQNKFIMGPLIRRINNDLLTVADETKPDVIWLYNDTHILPKTIQRLKSLLPGSVFAQYANDNPWGGKQSSLMWRHFIKSVPLFDVCFYYRPANEKDFRKAGAKQTALLRSYYIPDNIFPVERAGIEEKYRSDVVFVGHGENDGRFEALASLAETGCDVKLFGTNWNTLLARLPNGHPLKRSYPVLPARGEDYRKAICGAKIALSFLSKINEDTYTRRNFEIPAMKTFMLSEYSDDLATLFREGEEADFFRTTDELISKVRYYLQHEEKVSAIAEKGYERVKRDGHDVVTRMKQFMYHIERVRK